MWDEGVLNTTEAVSPQPYPKIGVNRKLPCLKWLMRLLKYQLFRLMFASSKMFCIVFPFLKRLLPFNREDPPRINSC